MPFGWVGFCDRKLALARLSEAAKSLQCLSAGWGFVTEWVVPEGALRALLVSNAFRLGGVL